MLDCFERITPNWLNRAFVYTGSVGPFGKDFRYRCAQDAENRIVHAAAYSRLCFELAEDVHQQDFSWDEAGCAALREWLQSEYEAFLAREAAQ